MDIFVHNSRHSRSPREEIKYFLLVASKPQSFSLPFSFGVGRERKAQSVGTVCRSISSRTYSFLQMPQPRTLQPPTQKIRENIVL